MTEQGPRKHANAMERATHLEKRAEELGVPVASLLPHADVWKKPRKQSEIKAVRREHLEPTSPGEPSWTSLVSEAMKNSSDELIFEPEEPSPDKPEPLK